MQQIAINENELATRWGVSPKTLQRWRSEGRGPRYLKLSKRVSYPLDEIFLFEERALHEATWERASDVVVEPAQNWRGCSGVYLINEGDGGVGVPLKALEQTHLSGESLVTTPGDHQSVPCRPIEPQVFRASGPDRPGVSPAEHCPGLSVLRCEAAP